MYRILIVEDHPIYRRGIKELLTEELDKVRIREAGNGDEALDLVRTEPWDTVVLDISLPGKNGAELLQELKKLRPTLPVLVLSMHPEEQYAVRMFKAGADGYLRKSASPTEVVSAVKKVLAGGTYVTDSVAEQLALSIKSTVPKLSHETLSDRESQVFRLLVSGKGLTEIAQGLDLTVTTISTYRSRILEKLHMTNNAELVRYAIKHGLVE
jgi:DNA-binding NarL/FixJ family response regulator